MKLYGKAKTEYVSMRSRIAYLLCALLLVCTGWVPFYLHPQTVSAETPGETLIVRVQYFGEPGSKIRERARFTRSDLEAMGADPSEWQAYGYSMLSPDEIPDDRVRLYLTTDSEPDLTDVRLREYAIDGDAQVWENWSETGRIWSTQE